MNYEELKTRKAELLKELSEVDRAIDRAKIPLVKEKLEQIETLLEEVYRLNDDEFEMRFRGDCIIGDFDDLREAISSVIAEF